jgi:hypothetical protein
MVPTTTICHHRPHLLLALIIFIITIIITIIIMTIILTTILIIVSIVSMTNVGGALGKPSVSHR